ncbi:MAG: transposase family protein [Planctomycetaceae bacterium]|nr:transposase family protein [Planctomycetaceae bacterium]
MATVEMDLDMPEGVKIRGFERVGDGHAFEVEWDLPETTTCEKCRRRHKTCVKHGDKIQVIRDLDVWGQPAFFVYQPPRHRRRG